MQNKIKEERIRIGLTQVQAAEKLSVSEATQNNYENDKRKPDLNYLIAFSEMGADINYIVTGHRSAVISDDERAVIDALRSMTAKDRIGMIHQILSGNVGDSASMVNSAKNKKKKGNDIQVTGDGNVTVGGSIHD